MLKYINIEKVSTRVVIKGDAIIAGSSRICFASRGRTQPINLAAIIVAAREKAMTSARVALRYMARPTL